ncbi:MAG: hypothetical protein AB1714_22315 [Acidobacteriota bacterium]
MSWEVRERVIVGTRSVVEIRRPELPAGVGADVVVVVEAAEPEPPPLASLLGRGRGCYSTASEADSFLRNERDACDR